MYDFVLIIANVHQQSCASEIDCHRMSSVLEEQLDDIIEVIVHLFQLSYNQVHTKHILSMG